MHLKTGILCNPAHVTWSSRSAWSLWVFPLTEWLQDTNSVFICCLIWILKSHTRFLPGFPHRILQIQSATSQTHKLGEEDTAVVRMLQEGKRNPGDDLMSAARAVDSLSFSLVSEGESRVCLSSVWNLLTRFRKILYSLHVFMLGNYPEQ